MSAAREQLVISMTDEYAKDTDGRKLAMKEVGTALMGLLKLTDVQAPPRLGAKTSAEARRAIKEALDFLPQEPEAFDTVYQDALLQYESNLFLLPLERF